MLEVGICVNMIRRVRVAGPPEMTYLGEPIVASFAELYSWAPRPPTLFRQFERLRFGLPFTGIGNCTLGDRDGRHVLQEI